MTLLVVLASSCPPTLCRSKYRAMTVSGGFSDFGGFGGVDSLENITHVVRREDHTTNAAIQLYMLQHMQQSNIAQHIPQIQFSIPLLHTDSGNKMSKRIGGYTLSESSESGIREYSNGTLKSATAPESVYRTLQKIRSNPLKRFHLTPRGSIEPPFWPLQTLVKGSSESQTGFNRTFRIEPPF